MTTPKLSYIIATRNDGFCGDPMDRLENTLEQIQVLQPDAEIIVVDYGSDGEELVKHVQWIQKFRSVYVPQAVGKPFHETLALNIGIRRARGEWIARLDQDILVGDNFVKWFDRTILHFNQLLEGVIEDNPFLRPAFFSLRRDLTEYRTKNAEMNELASELGVHPPIWSDWKADAPGFWRGAVGTLLAPRSAWHHLRGYDESLIHRNHMEHDLCSRFRRYCGLVNLGPIIDCDFYHQWHERCSGRQENEMKSDEELDKLPIQANDENWGLGNLELEEQ